MENQIKQFLKDKMTASCFENLHNELKISRRMLTFLLRAPSKFSSSQLFRLSAMTNLPLSAFKTFIT